MTPQQLSILKTAILDETDPTFIALRNTNETGLMAEWFNELLDPPYIIALPRVSTDSIGKVINYVAFEALTTSNRDKLSVFITLNPNTFDATKADIRAMLASDTGTGIFSGSLAGQGATTRAALLNIMLQNANRIEKLLSSGSGTTLSPSVPTFLGEIDSDSIVAALNF